MLFVCLFVLRKRLSPPLGTEGRVGEGGGGHEVGGRNEAEAVVTGETSYAVVTASYMRVTRRRIHSCFRMRAAPSWRTHAKLTPAIKNEPRIHEKLSELKCKTTSLALHPSEVSSFR